MQRTSLLLITLLFAGLAQAQPVPADWPTAATADVESVDAIMASVYDVISGPAGPRDWNRFKSLFRPEAKLIPIAQTPDGVFPMYWSVDQYIERAGGQFNQMGFFEVEIARVQEEYGHLTHVLSTYESRREPGAEPFSRGINSFQLLFDGARWWVVNIFWQSETPALPIPERYLPKG